MPAENTRTTVSTGKSNGHAPQPSNGNGNGLSHPVTDEARSPRQSDTLQSWKEIAAYLKRGVRTAQRWETVAGLPVRRPRPGDRSPVFAFPNEIDQWLHSRPTRNFD